MATGQARSFTGAGMLGFHEVNPGRAAWHLWYSQATFDAFQETWDDLSWVGGTPHEERDWEDGVEALPRPVSRPTPNEWHTEREDETRPTARMMEVWSTQEAMPDLETYETLEREQRRQEEERRQEEQARAVAQAKARARIKRERARRSQPRTKALPPPAPERRQKFVSLEQLAAFLGEDPAP